MHFMNPVPIMKLVEGIRGLQTSEDTFSEVRFIAEKMGKIFVEAKDMPGFVVNRILMPMINEAITVLNEGIAKPKDIDTAMQLGTNQPMGPLTLADFIGLDTCLSIMEVLYHGLGDTKYRPSPLLRQYVAAGWLGKKTGRGFYHYDL
jgi:3-hydroxybutyryl-CoA dehydrogenase